MSNALLMMNNTARSQYRYSVFEHKLITTDSLVFSRSFIVVKNRYGVIVYFTGLHKYAETVSRRGSICQPMTADNKAKLHYVCSMLNYVLRDNYAKYKADHIFQISKYMLECFFKDYAITKQSNGKYKSSQSVEKCILSITDFFQNLIRKHNGYLLINEKELYDEKIILTAHGKLEKKYIPKFKARIMPQHNSIFRDMPTKVFEILINQAFIHAKDIAFAICLQAFAGLRPGEVCNVRQDNSPLGCGIIQTFSKNRLQRAEIDLTKEYILRSDGVVCGRIKKERMARIHPSFLDAFNKSYKFHKDFLNRQRYEIEYCPMFVNNKGMAMTYFDYRNRFKKLVINHLRPLLLNHEDSECRLYGQMLYEHSLGLHVLRHWFSVQLVLMGEDIAQIQYWRGDSNPQSAFDYLQNKGDLLKELANINEQFAGLMIDWENGI